jgi:Domain of unknown function (DUF4091)
MKWLLQTGSLLLLVGAPLSATNLAGTWTEDGGYKMARQDLYPGGASTNTISRCWDGTTIKLFGGKGELLTWVTYLLGGNSDATNVMVTISSFTGIGTAAGNGFSAVSVSSANVWDYTARPYSLYKYGYLQEIGFDVEGAWNPSEYEMRQTPVRWRTPCTVNGNNDCIPDAPTHLFLNRPDANKFYPDAAVPIEEFGISSFTVSASSSQAIGGEVYISTSLPSGTYASTLTVYEGASISTSIPIQLLVYNFTMPAVDTVTVIADIGLSDLSMRLNGTRFPSSYFVDPYLTNSLRTAAFLHRHRIVMIGDAPGSTQDFPSTLYQKQIDGSAFTAAYGYGNGPNPSVGVPFYMVGTYGNWVSANWSTSTVTGASGYCTNVSSWTAYCSANNLKCGLYTPIDEASAANLQGEINTLSTWSSTAAACASGGNTLPFVQTGNLPTVASSAPFVNFVLSTNWIGVSSTVWQSYETAYSTTSGSSVGGYNAFIPSTDGLFPIQEAGIGPREILWGAWKYHQKYWFLWDANYWNDFQNPTQTNNGFNANSNNDDDLFNISKNFGYDNYPSTSATFGHTGPSFDNGNGSMLYPATDAVFSNPSYGFNGIIGSWRLNMLTRGIQDADIMAAAYAINPSSTTALVNAVVQNVLWANSCVTLSDCSYIYGDRPWSESANLYETTRESLEQIIAAAPSVQGNVTIQGRVTLTGTATIQ